MKSWYLSKTLWLNLIAALALMGQSRYGWIIDAEAQAGFLSLVNIILRFVTKTPLNWAAPAVTETPEGGYIRLQLMVLSLLFCSALLFAGCATTGSAPTANDSPQVLAGKSLLAVKSTIVVAATSADKLCKSGTLPVERCTQLRTDYEVIKPAYDAAVDAYLLMMMSTGGDTGDFRRTIERVQELAAYLLTLSNPLGPNGGAH